MYQAFFVTRFFSIDKNVYPKLYIREGYKFTPWVVCSKFSFFLHGFDGILML